MDSPPKDQASRQMKVTPETEQQRQKRLQMLKDRQGRPIGRLVEAQGSGPKQTTRAITTRPR